ncbi:helix-turn-helix domain-containing protein [Amycolatopsis sp. H20-H5]|uniref:helix-turn-helix domain-containing protein n=1 Tax=Amycolatopsis sp. H20-H5 TaxID=3046309 RepID=UPI002DB8F5E8|nr:helix-turn-helix transcriptional regulator [Amycolatopsis sp. H20-H5]MEC3979458.1 helix-turn-helix transcriptional regulator [Amycolatopsis sp. H20-H5]
MVKRKGISVRQRRVSADLRSWRLARGMSCKDVAEALDCSETKISRMETGERGLYADDVAAVLGFLRVPAVHRHELLGLLRAGEEKNWHEIHGKLPTNWKELIRFEKEAVAIRNYEPMLIPGLAQIPEYSRAIMRGANPKLSEMDVESLVTVRMTRQVILGRRTAPNVHLMLDESVLRRPVCDPRIMEDQLRRLLAVGKRSNVVVQIVPFTAAANPGLEGPFVILDFAAEPPVAYMDSRGTSSFLEEEAHIDRVRVAWLGIRAIALSPDESARLIADVLGDLTTREEREP